MLRDDDGDEGDVEVVKLGVAAWTDMTSHALRDALAGLGTVPPGRESCGLLVQTPGGWLRYARAWNVAKEPTNSFVIDPEAQRGAGRGGEVVGMVHSHPNGEARPSGMDLQTYVPEGWLYLVIGLATGQPVVGAFRSVRGDFVRCKLSLVM